MVRANFADSDPPHANYTVGPATNTVHCLPANLSTVYNSQLFLLIRFTTVVDKFYSLRKKQINIYISPSLMMSNI